MPPSIEIILIELILSGVGIDKNYRNTDFRRSEKLVAGEIGLVERLLKVCALVHTPLCGLSLSCPYIIKFKITIIDEMKSMKQALCS